MVNRNAVQRTTERLRQRTARRRASPVRRLLDGRVRSQGGAPLPSEAAAAGGGPQEIVVTGSRVERNAGTLERSSGRTSAFAGSCSHGRGRGRARRSAVCRHACRWLDAAVAGATGRGALGDPDGVARDGRPRTRRRARARCSRSLRASSDAAPTEVPLPLRHTDVRAVVTGYVSAVDVTQQFDNPYDEKIEAVYVFPLPEKAAVNEFVMTIGERKIRGILREKEEAQQIYEDARAQGYRARLLTQQRPNIFTQKVANIEPGKRIDVNIRYFHTLAYEDGWYEFVFPMVVGPRYNPPGSRDPVVAVPRDDFERGSRHGRPLSAAERALGARPRDQRRRRRRRRHRGALGHARRRDAPRRPDARTRRARGRQHRFPTATSCSSFASRASTIKSNLLTYTDAQTQQGYFTLLVYPPAAPETLRRQPVEMVFVLDTSGSMSGQPLAQARARRQCGARAPRPHDTFQIMNFSSSRAAVRAPSRIARHARQHRAGARHYVAGSAQRRRHGDAERHSRGARLPARCRRTRFVTFLTDGYIGNEAEILGEVQRTIGDARIFSFGVGNAVNRYSARWPRREGRGAAAYLGLETPRAT